MVAMKRRNGLFSKFFWKHYFRKTEIQLSFKSYSCIFLFFSIDRIEILIKFRFSYEFLTSYDFCSSNSPLQFFLCKTNLTILATASPPAVPLSNFCVSLDEGFYGTGCQSFFYACVEKSAYKVILYIANHIFKNKLWFTTQ